jgi:hypothetical protein
MFGSFPDDLLNQFKHDYAERMEQSFADKESMECNKPRAESHNGKSHIVKSCYPGAPEGGKLIRFGSVGANTAGAPKEGESEATKAKRAAFKARHAKNIAKGKSSAAYWANLTKWNEGLTGGEFTSV